MLPPRSGLSWRPRPPCRGYSSRPRWWRPVARLTPAVMLVYMWHMVPVVIAAVAFYPTGVMPQPWIGSAEWWELRPTWEALLTVILIPLIVGLLRLHRPLLRVLPTGLGPGLPWSPGRPGGRPSRHRVRRHQARYRRLCLRRQAADTRLWRLTPAACC